MASIKKIKLPNSTLYDIAAKTADTLDVSDTGSAINPIYFANGIPVATTYSLQASVPSGAKFTDTVYTLPAATSSTLGGIKVGSNLSISNGTLSVPTADGTKAGVTIVYPAASCTTFSSDNGTVTPLAVQKGAKMFAIPRVTSTDDAIVRFSGTGGEVQNSTIKIEDVTNSRDGSAAQVISVPAAAGTKKMVYGYCTDQIDGTSFIGGLFDADATEFPYNSGLAIGGSSGNLLWKGNRVAVTSDISLSALGVTATAAELNKMDGVTATTAELNYVDGVTSNIQTQLNAKITNPTTGSTGQVLKRTSSGGAEWGEVVALPTGGTAGQILTKNSATNGDASWSNFPSLNYLPLAGGTVTGTITADGGFIGNLDGTAMQADLAAQATNATNATNIYSSASTAKAYILGTTTASSANHATVYNSSVYTSGSVLYGAAWNDYAEYRICKENFKPGQVVVENGDDTLRLSGKRLGQDGYIVSDTFGFAIGETEEAKCPVAVTGRVLAYTDEPRENFKPGDAVCAGVNGTVSKMSREEIKEYPERIIGTVSAIPEYETWGTGNVEVNGRIWIKVK